MICAYCGRKARGTREHIISSGVLGLFPECFATIDPERDAVYENDPMVRDVCADCNNNRISYIDTYAKGFVETYFVRKYNKDDTLSIDYNYTLLQKMCIKYAFNDMRSRRKDVSFFDDEIKNYLLDETKNTPLRNVTLLAGLAVNTSPAPDFMFGNRKLRWGDSPLFLSNSLLMNIDYATGKLYLRDKVEREQFKKCALSYVFRFNSVQILMLCWEKDISEEDLNSNKIVLTFQYPYQILDESGTTLLSRCTSEVTYHHEKIIDVTWGQSLWDEVSEMRGIFSEKTQRKLSEIEAQWNLEEQTLAANHPRR